MINIKIDSRKVNKGDIFVALPGATVDGHDYVEQAYKNGAIKAIVEHQVECPIEQEVVADTNKWITDYISEHYAKEIKDMNIIGVTGTNGKTTTAYLTYQILNELGSKTAYIGTIGFYLPDEDFIELPNTTPNILDLYELFLTAKEHKCKNVMMEVSSHSLDQKRVQGITFKVAAFTNLTQDHLDYHKTMGNYLKAKMLILKQLEGPMIVNADDETSSEWIKAYKNTLTFGFKGEDYKIENYEDTEKGTLIKFKANNKNYEVETNLRSRFNVYNYLTSLSLINQLGYSIEEIIKVTKDIYPPKGRCEIIKLAKGEAVVDYAHTPDGVKNVIDTVKELNPNNIITIIGCGGNRDVSKRSIMGTISTRLSDYVIFTDDNPRYENELSIIDDIIQNIDTDNYEIITNREKAIIKGIQMLSENDILLVLGKGHENYQIIGDNKMPFSDKEIVLKNI